MRVRTERTPEISVHAPGAQLSNDCAAELAVTPRSEEPKCGSAGRGLEAVPAGKQIAERRTPVASYGRWVHATCYQSPRAYLVGHIWLEMAALRLGMNSLMQLEHANAQCAMCETCFSSMPQSVPQVLATAASRIRAVLLCRSDAQGPTFFKRTGGAPNLVRSSSDQFVVRWHRRITLKS
jgi:ribosomal protein L34E